MGSLGRDLRLAMRTLVRHHGSSLLAALCLAAGIGINVTMFAGADPWLFRPLPYREAGRLAALQEIRPHGGATLASAPSFFDWKQGVSSFREWGVFARSDHNLATEVEPERVHGAAISAHLFPMLGVQPVLGRGFTEKEDRPGGPSVCLISHDLWQRRFGEAPDVLGRTLRIDGTVHAIVGVMPPKWRFPEYADVWTPLRLDPSDRDREARPYSVIARLAEGASLSRANRELAAVARRAAAEHPETNAGWGARAYSLRETLTPPGIRLALVLMLGATVFVLLIACANVANLLLAQAIDRRREIATRIALGAGPGRLLRQLLLESLLLSLAGAAIGVPLGFWGTALMRSSIPIAPPFWAEMVVGPRVLALALLASVLAAVVFGLAPALQARRLDVRGALQEGGRGSSGGRRARWLGDRLVVAELALSVMLLGGAGLMLRSFLARQGIDPGFQARGALVARVMLAGPRYQDASSRVAFLDEAVRRLRALPGVETGAAVRSLPFSDPVGGGWATASLEVDGRPVPSAERPAVVLQSGTGNTLEALGIPVTRGRGLTDSDLATETRVAVVSEGLARHFWPEADPIGRQLRLSGGPWLRVVGVAGEVREPPSILGLEDKPAWQVYLPYSEDPVRTMVLVARGPRPEALAASVREVIHELDPSLALDDVRSLAAARRRADWVALLWGELLAWAAAIGALLAATGTYGVISRGVARRTPEIGVRMALGADRRSILGLVLRGGLRLALAGCVLGLLGALLLTRSLAGLLYGVAPGDPATLLGSALLLAGVALLASYAPAYRATRVDPQIALRSE